MSNKSHIKDTYKSKDTEEWFDTVFNRPVAIARTANAKGRADIVDSPVALVPLGLARFGKQSYDIENQNHPHDTAGRLRNFIKTMLNW